MTPRLTAETLFCFAPAQTLASPSTLDGKVVVGRTLTFVNSTIELACTGIAHKQGQGSPLPLWPSASLLRSGQRHGRWCRVRAPSSAQRRVRPISDLFQPYVNANDRMTHMQHACSV